MSIENKFGEALEMSLLQQDYTALFNGITGVLNTLEHMNCGQAQADLSQLNITAERALLRDACARAAARNRWLWCLSASGLS